MDNFMPVLVESKKRKVVTCKSLGCKTPARLHGLCYQHGGARLCISAGCSRKIYGSKAASYCSVHGGAKSKASEARNCKRVGCSEPALKYGKCIHHGGLMCRISCCRKFTGPPDFRECLVHSRGESTPVVRDAEVQQENQCKMDGCSNTATKRGKCAEHGGAKKLCKKEGCTELAAKRGICISHGGLQCYYENCHKQSVGRMAYCAQHDRAFRKPWSWSNRSRLPCKIDGCSSFANRKGLCFAHGGRAPLKATGNADSFEGTVQ